MEIIWCLLVGRLPDEHWLIYVNPFARLLDFAIGMMIGYAYKRQNVKRECDTKSDAKPCTKRILLILTVGIVSIYGSGLYHFFNESFGYFYLVAAWTPITVILLWLFLKKKGKFESRILLWIGNISMELFFIHQLVIRYWNYASGLLGLPNEFIGFFVCLVLAMIFAFLWRKIVNRIGFLRLFGR